MNSHFSSEPADAMTLRPSDFAIWMTKEPTGPNELKRQGGRNLLQYWIDRRTGSRSDEDNVAFFGLRVLLPGEESSLT